MVLLVVVLEGIILCVEEVVIDRWFHTIHTVMKVNSFICGFVYIGQHKTDNLMICV